MTPHREHPVTGTAPALGHHPGVRRHYPFYAVTVGVPAIWIGLLRLLPESLVANPATVVPLVVLTNLQVSAFYLTLALLVLDRDQGGLVALLSTSLSIHGCLWITTASLTFLGVAQNIVIVRWVFGPRLHWILFILSCAALSVLYIFAATCAIAAPRGITRLLLPLLGWVTIFTSPLLSYYDVAPWWVFAWHPFMPALRLLESSCRELLSPMVAIPMLGSATWCAVALVLAHRRIGTVLRPSVL